ncbi:MAG: DUF177 domain-containing protein [Mariprofundaceae bacterium]|nr:DUF177 domain-containing protein [Mariprofundaceae bacterium]
MSHKVCINLQDISAAGKSWNMDVSAAVLMDVNRGDVNALKHVCHDAHWQGVIERAYGVYTLRGEWSVSLLRQCDRCMGEFEWASKGDSTRSYAFEEQLDMDEEERADIEIVSPPGALNLVDVLREEVWLAWKPCVICKDSCKGLCQGCGVNLNHDVCQCKGDHSDNPFAALAKMKFDA